MKQQESDFLVQQSAFTISLTSQREKILYCTPMFEQTIIIVTCSPGVQTIQHLKKNGNIIYEKVYSKTCVQHFHSVSDHQLFYLSKRVNKLFHLNLRVKEIQSINFCFNDNLDTVQVFMFSSLSILCICQFGGQKTQYIKISYFIYPLKKDSAPIYIFESNLWNSNYILRQANDKSMVVFFQDYYKEDILFQTFDLNSKEIKKYRLKMPFESYIFHIWHLSQQKFSIALFKESEQQKSEVLKGKDNSIIIFDGNKQCYRQSFVLEHINKDYTYLSITQFGLCYVLEAFRFLHNDLVESVIYLIDNQRETIILQSSLKFEQQIKNQIPGSCANALIRKKLSKKQKISIQFQLFRVIEQKEIFVQLLTCLLGEDNDQQLVETAVGLLI